MNDHQIREFPASRLATIDVCAIGRQKHHVTAMIELDVTGIRDQIRQRRKNGHLSFTGWLTQVIGHTIAQHPEVASFRTGKRKLMLFNDVNVSMVVEKLVEGKRVPIPLVIEQADKRTAQSITKQISEAKEKAMDKGDLVLHKRSDRLEKLYTRLPGFARRAVWKYILNHPGIAYPKMGNVAITTLGMIGNVKGWFIPISVHPICFGIGNIVRKPGVINNAVEIREILHMTILIDHDVADGAPMTRFLHDLSKNIESGMFLDYGKYKDGAGESM